MILVPTLQVLLYSIHPTLIAIFLFAQLASQIGQVMRCIIERLDCLFFELLWGGVNIISDAKQNYSMASLRDAIFLGTNYEISGVDVFNYRFAIKYCLACKWMDFISVPSVVAKDLIGFSRSLSIVWNIGCRRSWLKVCLWHSPWQRQPVCSGGWCADIPYTDSDGGPLLLHNQPYSIPCATYKRIGLAWWTTDQDPWFFRAYLCLIQDSIKFLITLFCAKRNLSGFSPGSSQTEYVSSSYGTEVSPLQKL